MTHLVFFLEERSAEEMLKGFLPTILPDTLTFRFVVFEGKQDLEKQLSRKLRKWRAPLPRFIVLRDQDGGVCTSIKQKLADLCVQAGHETTLIRIACHELESWYMGDLQAVEQGLRINGLASKQRKEKFRNPDHLSNASEELKELTSRKYQKISGSRAIGPYLSAERNQSPSFRVFVEGVRRLVSRFRLEEE
jgi:Domain of unknown function (DUF4276)